ncbi:MAG: ribulose-phosphate 3-epimerase [Atribacterota bacterium]|nr:ribulose-phosphate 3-epimerase [Atribacterota bacterium]
MTKRQLAASILNADFSCLREVLSMLEKSKVDLVHLDIMDGNFVPNITFGPKIVATIRRNTNLPLSVHLMIEKPERYIKDFSEVINKQDSLIIHVETCPHLDKTLQMILDCGLKAGVALNPSTPLEMIKYVLDKLNIILIMTVNPGFGGQQFIPSMLLKIADTREIIEQSEKDIAIQVDGGINSKNIVKVKQAGANILVVGSEIFKAQCPEKVIENIQKILKLS